MKGTLLNQLFIRKELEEARLGFVQIHAKALFRAVLGGFAGVAPRSVTPNLTELLSILLSRCTEECRVWVREILYSVSDWLPAERLHSLTFSRPLERFCGIQGRSRGEGSFHQSYPVVSTRSPLTLLLSHLDTSGCRSRSMKKTRDAANEFTLVARGLEGANFGYATITR